MSWKQDLRPKAKVSQAACVQDTGDVQSWLFCKYHIMHANSMNGINKKNAMLNTCLCLYGG